MEGWARRGRELTGAVTLRLAALDRRLPVDGRYVLAAVAILVVAAGVLTSGFGVVGGRRRQAARTDASPKPHVAVLNGTGVSGLAALRGQAGRRRTPGTRPARSPMRARASQKTVAMFAPGHEPQAKKLAKAIKPKLGDTPTKAMTADVTAHANGAPLALGLGLDDSQFGGGSG